MLITNMPKTRKRSEHYVNNKDFLAAIIEYKIKVRRAAEKEIPNLASMSPDEQFEILKTWKSPNKPRITNYLGECFLKIATHLSYKPNFVNYMFKDDMVCDGIENCIQYINNFNPEKSQNPFAYFTQIIHYAFLRRIQREKKQMEIKNKILERSGYDEVFVDNNTLDRSNYSDYNQIKDNVHTKLRS
jgi:hypothetical protein